MEQVLGLDRPRERVHIVSSPERKKRRVYNSKDVSHGVELTSLDFDLFLFITARPWTSWVASATAADA